MVEFFQAHWNGIFGLVLIGFGIAGLLGGRLTASDDSEGSADDRETRVLEGSPARILAVGYLLAGGACFIAFEVGIVLAIIVAGLTWFLGRSTSG